MFRQAYSKLAGKEFLRWFYFERAGVLLEDFQEQNFEFSEFALQWA